MSKKARRIKRRKKALLLKNSENNIQHSYKYRRRKLIRPDINYWKALLNVIIPLFVFSIVAWKWEIRFAILGIAIYFLIRLRGILIWLVHVYQRYAPDDMRLACEFEPSCSEYMILSIRKYGAFFGVINGIRRLLRCRYPGGIDYP